MLALESGDTLALENGIVLHSLPNQNFFYAFSVVTGDQFRLNRTSFWVLETIGEGIEGAQLKDKFLEAFEVNTIQGETDLNRLLSDLYEQKIIRRHNNEK